MISKLSPALLLVVLLGIGSPSAEGQKKDDKPLPGDEMIYKYLCAEADKLSAKFLDGAKTLEEWQKKRPRLHQEYMDMLGLWPIPEKTPLKATITGTMEHEGVVIDKLHFQSKPGLYVTANLYRPAQNRERLPAIVYVCGHSNKGRDGNKSAYQDHGMWFASNGYVCIVLDTLQLGEIPGIHHGTYGIREKKPVETRFWWHSAGYTPAGVECWNGIRAIDYLLTRADVDKDRIGVTGISGGGAATFWIAAADERVKVAVPVSGMADLQSYINNKIINGHCDCMFLYNTFQWDWTTIAALIAPRPLLFANSDNDPIFPMDANRRVIAKLKNLYTMYGKPNLVDELVSKGGHAYRPDLRVGIFRFINEHLKKDTKSRVKDVDFKVIPGKELRVFPTDADIPKDVLNGKIDETFVPRAQVKLPEKGKFEEWKKQYMKELREKVFRMLPDPVPAAEYLGRRGPINYFFSSEPGIEHATSGIISDPKGKGITLVVLNPNDDFKVLAMWCERFDGNRYVEIVGGRGGETVKSPPNFVERSHLLLGKPMDAGRVLDIAGLARHYSQGDKTKKEALRMAGKGQGGIFAAYAALFEPSIKEVVIIDPPKSHKEGPHFLNVLRVLDIPEALGLLAPTPLTLINAQDPAFDRTAEIYRLAGAADKLTRK